MSIRPKKFIELFLEDITDGYRHDGLKSLIPFLFIIVFLCSFLFSFYLLPSKVFGEENAVKLISIFAALLTFNAITFALSWSSLTRVLELISTPGFSSYLRQNDMINGYIFYLKYIQFWQVIACITTFCGLLFTITYLDLVQLDRIIFAMSSGCTAFALRWAVGSISILADLTFYHSKYDSLPEADKAQLRLVST